MLSRIRPSVRRQRDRVRRVVSVLVRGDSLPAFAAALALAEVGVGVRLVLDGDPRWPDEPVRDHTGALRSLLERVSAPLGQHGPSREDAAPLAEQPTPVCLRDRTGAWAPVPQPSLFGIPAVLASSETLAFLSRGAAFHAYLDRIRPPLTIGKTHELGALVQGRMGPKLLQALVEPLVRERFGVEAAEVETAIAAPGINEALTRTGSLSGAVLEMEPRTAEREQLVAPADGWEAARDAMLERLRIYGVAVVEGENAESVETAEPGESEALPEIAFDAQIVDAHDDVFEAKTASPRFARWVAKVPVTVADAREGGSDPTAGAVDRVCTVEAAGREQWSVRLTRTGDGSHATLSGPRTTQGGTHADLGEVLAAAGLSAAGEARSIRRAAPFITRAERDSDLARLKELRERDPELIPVGTAFTGDDLSVAVDDAADAAIALRRRLVGISE